jgi:hypothetical protein
MARAPDTDNAHPVRKRLFRPSFGRSIVIFNNL